VTEELEILWSLHGLDERVAALSVALKRHVSERAGLDQRLQSERVHLETHKQKVAALQLKRRELEREIETLGAEERKYASQLPMVKKNEEYTALLTEIQGAKSRRSDRETDLLMLMEEEEEAGRERPVVERTLQGVEAEANTRRREIDAEEGGERDQLTALEAERASLLGRLPTATRTRYERIRGSRDGRAVVPIVKGACGGCFRGQPPQMLQEARRGDRLLVCDGCGRLLIWPPDAA
jgi:predicted  nucleic acid-binding Zn-ribbon protein